MTKMTTRASPVEAEDVLKDMNKLIRDLREACRTLEPSAPGFVDLSRALDTAENLRFLLLREQECNADWREILEAILFLAEVMREIYSFLFCKSSQEGFDENWVHHKNVAYC